MKKNLFTLVGSICLVLVLAALLLPACAAEEPTPTPKPTPAPAPVEPIVLKYATYWAPTFYCAEGWDKPFFDEFEKRTGGRVKVERYYAESLAKARDLLDATSSGLCDFGFFPLGYKPGLCDLCDYMTLPFPAKDNLNLAKAIEAVRKKGYFTEAFAKFNVMRLNSCQSGLSDMIFTDRKPLTLEDFAGTKTRSLGYGTFAVEAMGMTTVGLAGFEYYDAMQKGILEMYWHAPASISGRKLQEVCDYYLKMGLCVTGDGGMLVNLDSYNKLPPDIQDILMELGDGLGVKYAENAIKRFDAAYAEISEAGCEVYSLSDAEYNRVKEAVILVWQLFVDNMEEKGLPGKEIVADFVSELKKLGEEPPYSPK